MINRGQYGDLPLPLTEIQLALVYLSDGDPQFIVTREYQKSDWRGLIRAYQRGNHLNQLSGLEKTVSIYLNRGDGTFLPRVNYAIPNQPQQADQMKVSGMQGKGPGDLSRCLPATEVSH